MISISGIREMTNPSSEVPCPDASCIGMNIIVETPRLILRELIPEDISDLSLVLSDVDSMKYYPHAFSRSEVESWIERNIRRYKTDGFGLWAVVRKEDSQFLGDCGITLQNIDGETLPEIGYHIIPEFRNSGYATEAANACKHYAITALGFDAVFSYSVIDNTPSQRVAQKIGMKWIKSYNKDSLTHVVYCYQKLYESN